jgi:hypothetical protein
MDPTPGVPWKKDYTTTPDVVQKRITFQGIPVQIERPKGFKKTWEYKGTSKPPTTVVYKHDYGAIPGTKDYDGEELDVFMGPNKRSKKVFVVSKGQTHDKSKFDEHKVLLGFSNMQQANKQMQQYLSETMQGIREMHINDFKKEIDKHGLIKRAFDAGQQSAWAKFSKDLTARGRRQIKTKNFALPGKKKYPINDEAHARNALARVSQFGTSGEKSQVRAAVRAKYPGISVTS